MSLIYDLDGVDAHGVKVDFVIHTLYFPSPLFASRRRGAASTAPTCCQCRRLWNNSTTMSPLIPLPFFNDWVSPFGFVFWWGDVGKNTKIMKCFSAFRGHVSCFCFAFFLTACDFTARTVKKTDNKHYANPQQQRRRRRVQILASYLLCVMHPQPLPASPLKTASRRQFIRVHWGSRDEWGHLAAAAAHTQRIAQPRLGSVIVLLSF